MSSVRLSELPQKYNPSLSDELLIFDSDKKLSAKITIASLPSLVNFVLNEPCIYCGSRGKYDIRGNCGACGAPVE
jgi:hypothetical protein